MRLSAFTTCEHGALVQMAQCCYYLRPTANETTAGSHKLALIYFDYNHNLIWTTLNLWEGEGNFSMALTNTRTRRARARHCIDIGRAGGLTGFQAMGGSLAHSLF